MATRNPVTVDLLKEKTGITEVELGQEIRNSEGLVLWRLAGQLGSCERFILVLPDLNTSDKEDVRTCAHKDGNQAAMSKALELWRKRNPYVTFRHLIEIILELGEGGLADEVCRKLHVVEKLASVGNIDPPKSKERSQPFASSPHTSTGLSKEVASKHGRQFNSSIREFESQVQHDPIKMLLVGETGSGKTSFVNLLANCGAVQVLGCGFGAEGLEQFRHFNDIKLENALAISMASKTSGARLYNVKVSGLKVEMIDTPGFGDSRGLEQDQRHVMMILDALKQEEYINCVCLIINGRQGRLSAFLKYVLTEITAILPKEILDNVIVVFSNTSDPLDLNLDPESLTAYFGKEVKHIFCVENPYCRFEKAMLKVEQLGIKRIAPSLQKSFEDTSEILTEMCATIKNFPKVSTSRFMELYDKRRTIESNVLRLLCAYDNQVRLEKAFRDVKDEATKSKMHQERAQIVCDELEKKRQALKAEKKKLSGELLKQINEFQHLGVARNCAILIENQLAVIETRLKGTTGPELDDLRRTKTEMEIKLKLIRELMTLT